MGRSDNSRNRVFTTRGEGIITEAFDESRLIDPSLIIYAPVRVRGKQWIVTNGDQTDTIYDALQEGHTFEDALRTRTFEPDAPNYTPRISALLTREEHRFSYQMSILKSNDGNPDAPQRFFFDYPQPVAGEGHFLHTYRGNGNPLPSFEGEPECVTMGNDIDAWTDLLWRHLHAENRVSLYVCWIRLADGAAQTRIVNQNV
ncbi:MAG: IMP cyclohydrolase, partial [Clostridia bacterium]